MPAYNAEHFISESIRSVMNQTYGHWELIIVDDGSTDATADKVHALKATEARIHYVFQKNAGQGEARNKALRESKGDYIAFLDSDDLWVMDKLSTQVAMMQNNHHIDLVFGSALAFQGSIDNTLQPLNHNNSHTYHGHSAIRQFLKGNKIPILTVLVKREVMEAVGHFDGARHLQNVEDSHLWLKLLLSNYTLKSSPEVLAYYRIHEGQVTSNKFKNRLKEINLIKDFLGRDAAIDKDILTEIKNKYYGLFIRERSAEEKESLMVHYLANYRIQDKLVFKNLLKTLPLRGFSIYYRYVHTRWFTQQKMI